MPKLACLLACKHHSSIIHIASGSDEYDRSKQVIAIGLLSLQLASQEKGIQSSAWEKASLTANQPCLFVRQSRHLSHGLQISCILTLTINSFLALLISLSS